MLVEQTPHVTESLVGDLFMVDVGALSLAGKIISEVHSTRTAAICSIKNISADKTHNPMCVSMSAHVFMTTDSYQACNLCVQ